MPVDNELNPVLGIDLGTTFSAVARWDGRGTRVYNMRNGDSTLPSVVYYDPNTGEFVVGKQAFLKGLVSPENAILGVKRMMDDAAQKILLGGKEFSPIEISAKILRRLYDDVADKFPTGRFSSRGTVVTVPYYFKAHQCENTRKAAEMADIGPDIHILQEPIAASLEYVWELLQDTANPRNEEIILVFDLGGGTFDLTLFKLERTQEKIIFEVIATGGDDRLGGMDFDECLLKVFLDKAALSLNGLSAQEERRARRKLLEQAVEAKISLSAIQNPAGRTPVAIPDVLPGTHIDIEVSRAEFEASIQPYVTKIENIISQLWEQASMQRNGKNVRIGPADVDRVIRVGGSSKIPCMRTLLDDLVGPDKVWGNVNADLCVAEGAALYAAWQDDREALGCDLEIRSRISHALGVETEGGRFFPLIRKNRKTPCEARHLFMIDDEELGTLDINVYQGSSSLVEKNSRIGTLHIPDLPKPRQGELPIDVTFKVSADQSLSVAVEIAGHLVNEVFNYT